MPERLPHGFSDAERLVGSKPRKVCHNSGAFSIWWRLVVPSAWKYGDAPRDSMTFEDIDLDF